MGRAGPPIRKEQIECQFAFKTVATKCTSDPDGGGQLWQKRRERQEMHEKERWRHERQERRSTSEPEPESKQGRCLLALRQEGPCEHRMLVESKESVWRQWNSKHRRQGKTDEPHRQREQARWNREKKVQWWNHCRSQLLRALSTWRRLK